MLVFWITVTLFGIVGARIVLGDWVNYLSTWSVLCGSTLMLLNLGWVGSTATLSVNSFHVLSIWLLVFTGSVMVHLLRGRKLTHLRQPGWEYSYLCRSHNSLQDEPTSPGWQLFVLLILQVLLLGSSDDVDIGKICFAVIYLLFLISWLPQILRQRVMQSEPIVRWTVLLLCLVLFSRISGAWAGISTGDWMRDSLPFLHYSWILIGPFAFGCRKRIWKAYLLFLLIVVILTFVVTDQYMVLRRFVGNEFDVGGFLRTSDAVILFGVFMTVPVAGLPFASRYRVVFGLLAVGFIGAAVLSGTRIHVAAIVAGLLMYFWLTRGESTKIALSARRAALVSVLLALVALAVTLQTGIVDSSSMVQRTEEVKGLDFGALTQRIDESLVAWRGFRERPLFGQGLGYKIDSVLWATDNSPSSDLYMVHNFYMYVPLKFGLLGIPVVFAFILSMFRSAISTYRQATLPFDKAFSAGLASLLMALAVESVTSSRFQDKWATPLLSVLIALLLSIRRRISAEQSSANIAQIPATSGGESSLSLQHSLA